MERLTNEDSVQSEEQLAPLKHKCQKHKGQLYQFISFDPKQESVFQCLYCFSQKLPQFPFIPIHQICTADSKTVFSNFPINEQSISDQILDFMLDPPDSQQLQIKIQTFFKDFQINFLQKLDTIRKKMLEKAKGIDDLSSQIIETYSNISQKNKLKEIVLDETKPLTLKSTEIKQLYANISSQNIQNKQAIQLAFEKLKQFQTSIDFDTPNEISTSLLDELDEVDMFLDSKVNAQEDSIVKHLKQIPISFTRTKVQESQQINITKNQRPTQISLLSGKSGSVVTDILDNSKAYLLRVQFSKPISEISRSIYIGLIANSEKDSPYLHFSNEQGIWLGHKTGDPLIIRGEKISSEESDSEIYSLEFRWCITDQQFIYSDTNFVDINKLDENLIIPNQEYRLAIYLSQDDNVRDDEDEEFIDENDVKDFQDVNKNEEDDEEGDNDEEEEEGDNDEDDDEEEEGDNDEEDDNKESNDVFTSVQELTKLVITTFSIIDRNDVQKFK